MERNHLKNSELFSAVTHEIKNSLNPVINLSSILLRNTSDRLTSDENSYLEVIERNGKKILNLVDEFSFLNKIGKSKREHSYTSVSMRELIDNAVIGMMALSSYSGCELVCDIEDETVLPITDRELLHRIVQNICLFFLTSGGDHPSIYFKTAVSDNKLFLTASRRKTFINDRAVPITQGQRGGSPFISSAGLPAVPETEFPGPSDNEFHAFDKNIIIEKGYSASSVMWLNFASLYAYHLNGDVSFFSDDTGDTAFQFLIPLENSAVKTAEAAQNAAENDVDTYSGREFIMLVIDDGIDNIIPVNAIIDHEFKGRGIVYHAESGGRALDILESVKPDIILLDLTLPDISGLSLVKNIKHLFVEKKIPVIAFTGMDMGNTDKIIRAGFDDIIKKPFNIDTFIHKIRKWID